MSLPVFLEDNPVASGCSITQSNPLATQKHLQPEYTSGHPSPPYVDEEAESPPKFSDPYEEHAYLKHRLAIAFRVFAQFGLAEGVAGHITLRDPVDPDSFWVNPFGTHFSLIRDQDLIRVDHDGTVVEGGKNKMVKLWKDTNGMLAAYAIHTEIHKARLDVLCAAHSHSLYGRAICATGRTLDMLTQDFCVFHNDHVLYTSFAGLVLAPEDGKGIVKCLGNKKAALLGNHGILTAGPTIEATRQTHSLRHPILDTDLLVLNFPHMLELVRYSNRLEVISPKLESKDIHILRIVIATAITTEPQGKSELCDKLIAAVEQDVGSISSTSEVELKDIQIMAILSIYFCHVEKELFAWRAIGRAARQCLEMGLHRKQSLPSQSLHRRRHSRIRRSSLLGSVRA
ncbi:class II aldolase/adducin domain protein [Penicillium verrucosum]|uniref:class II aldolase/adducin domain protein n=1 Tax=Penicillium verrucosum TaxID=60171 RepID=UPI0025453C5B|nr:class II aldolase/adducin domain protein [Penicillium verrucosum]KAJ5945444.1 class II aldolase/adducin domain protein [Penicillium verrucosum]